MEMHRLMCEKTSRPEMDDDELEELLNQTYDDHENPPVTRLANLNDDLHDLDDQAIANMMLP